MRLLELTVKQPESMTKAKAEFLAWAAEKNYAVDSILVQEQLTFFEEKPDAVIYAVVRRKKNAYISPTRQADGEPAVAVHFQQAGHQHTV